MDDARKMLINIMKLMNWKQGQLAEELSTSQATVSRWISGKQSPDKDSWIAIGNLYDKVVGRPDKESQQRKARGELAVKELLREIDGLPEEAINPLWRVVLGFLEDAERSEQSQPQAQSEYATPRREALPSR